MFRIDRSALVAQIALLGADRSLLVTGSPGSGKSWLIAQLVRSLKRNKRSLLAIVAEDYPVASEEQLSAALGFSCDTVSVLRALSNDPVLVIDGLDSLRSDPSQRVFRAVIKRFFNEIPDGSLVATIRTFDLRQSAEFQSLFFNSLDKPGARTVEFAVPPLSDIELANVASQMPALASLIGDASPDFKSVLRNPFNLRLASELVSSDSAVREISGFHSEVQLLTRYWKWRVEGPDVGFERLSVLRRATQFMVSEKVLSAPESFVHEGGSSAALSSLLSDEVFRRSPTGRISYDHNILFDYGAARLLLDEENISGFIEEDTSRSIFFRPSLAYFFQYLWQENRESFWSVSFSLIASDKIPARAKIIPAVAIYQGARNLNDLDPLMDPTSASSVQLMKLTLRAAQTLGAFRTGNRSLWLSVLSYLSNNPNFEFINESTALISIAADPMNPDDSPSVLSLAVRLLMWIWDESDDPARKNALELAEFGASRVLPLVLANYGVDPEIGKTVVRRVLGRYGSLFASSHEAFRLANAVRTISQYDLELVGEIYRRTFGFKETSQETTQLGGSVILSLRSTKAQDFSSALYALKAAFSAVVERSFEQATVTAIDAVNAEVAVDQPMGKPFDTLPVLKFDYDGHPMIYRSDSSEIWDSGPPNHTSLELLTTILNRAAEGEDPKGGRLAQLVVRLVAQHSQYAVAWKHILDVAMAHPSIFYAPLREVLCLPQFISAPEVTIGVGRLLTIVFEKHLVSDDDCLAFESAIMTIPTSPIIVHYENPGVIRNRLLMCIPRTRIVSAEACELADELIQTGRARANRPYHEFGFFQEPVTIENHLKEIGVGINDDDNRQILPLLKDLQELDSRFLNSVPSTEKCLECEPLLRQMHSRLTELKVDERLAGAAWGVACAVAYSILRNKELKRGDALVSLCLSIALRSAKEPIPTADPTHHDAFDTPVWGRNQARIESAQALSQYLWNWGLDSEVLSAFVELSQDPVPAVRFQIALHLGVLWQYGARSEFWTLAETMIRNEKTAGVLVQLIHTIGGAAAADPDRTAEIVTNIYERVLPPTKNSELPRSLLQVLVALYAIRDEPKSSALLARFERDPTAHEQNLAEEIYAASQYIGAGASFDVDVRARALELWRRIVCGVHLSMEHLADEPDKTVRYEHLGRLLKISDHIGTRIFHILGISPYSPDQAVVPDAARLEKLYFDVKPIIALLVSQGSPERKHYLSPHTALYLMQIFNAVLRFDAAAVIEFASAVSMLAKDLDFHFQTEAISEITKLVGQVLADHRELLRMDGATRALGEMLDLFVSAGWPEALRMTFRLDEAIR